MNRSLYFAASPWFVLVASVFYGSMALALCIANIYWWVAAPVFILLCLHYVHVIRIHGLRKHKHSVGILCQDCDKWQYQLHSGRRLIGTLDKQRSFSSSAVIILYMQHLTGGRYIVIPRDALSANNFRFLAFKLQS